MVSLRACSKPCLPLIPTPICHFSLYSRLSHLSQPKTAKTPRARLHTKAAALAKAERKQQAEAGENAASGGSKASSSVHVVGDDAPASGADRARLDKRRKAAMVARAGETGFLRLNRSLPYFVYDLTLLFLPTAIGQTLAAAANPVSALGTPSTHPYSRSHLKRLKRKARENLVGGSLSAIEGALADVMPDEKETKVASSVKKKGRMGMDVDDEIESKPVRANEPARIGEGKGKPLKEKQKRKEM